MSRDLSIHVWIVPVVALALTVRRSEFDPSWLVVRILAAIRLVVIVGTPVSRSAGHA